MGDSSDETSADTETEDPPSESDSVKTYIKQGIRDFVMTALIFALFAALLFAYTGMWPPLVSVESGSMEPDLERGDLVVMFDADRADAPEGYEHHGIVTHEQGHASGHTSFGDHGNVILFTPNSGEIEGQNIIHRAMFYVEEGENWHGRANDSYMSASNCDALNYCPAPNDGFITKGDANGYYDQSRNISGPVPKDDVHGVAGLDIPYLGHLRLMFG